MAGIRDGRIRPAAGPAARLEVEVLLGAALGRSREWLFAHPESRISSSAVRKLSGWMRRRVHRRDPLAYLTGVREFAGLAFAVGRGVLIPRPETEGLLERVEAHVRCMERSGGWCVVDLGTGSGALAVALAKWTGVRVIATDLSPVAVRMAKQNSARHGVADLVTVLRGSWAGPIMRIRPLPQVAVVMSNPPYVSDRLLRRTAPEVRREPRLALAGGRTGLDAIRLVLRDARRILVPGGLLAMEIGAEQGRAVTSLLARDGWRAPRTERDLAGRTRYALAVTSA